MQDKHITHVLGIDISKKSLDVCLFNGQQIIEQLKISNKEEVTKTTFKKLLTKYRLDISKLIVCAEHTGMYSYPLIEVVKELELSLWLENGAEIKLSSGVQRSKNDKIDAYRIACYAFRFIDKATFYNTGSETIEKLSYLNSERDLLIKDRAKYTGQLRDQKNFMNPVAYKGKAKRLQILISGLSKAIKEIEQQMQELLCHEPELKQQYTILTSVRGVGKQVAINTLIATKAFKRFSNPRKFCCHVGVAPFEQQSGSSQRSKNKVSQRANKKLKTLFHMAALSAIRVKGELQNYYHRKVAEGKNKMTVINSVRGKIIHRMFALIKDNRLYEKNPPTNLVLS